MNAAYSPVFIARYFITEPLYLIVTLIKHDVLYNYKHIAVGSSLYSHLN